MKYPALKSSYIENNQQIEKWSEIIYLIVAKMTPIAFILPKFIVSIFIYFTTNLENDAFELPLPMWYVEIQLNPHYKGLIICKYFKKLFKFFYGICFKTQGFHSEQKIQLVIWWPQLFNT